MPINLSAHLWAAGDVAPKGAFGIQISSALLQIFRPYGTSIPWFSPVPAREELNSDHRPRRRLLIPLSLSTVRVRRSEARAKERRAAARVVEYFHRGAARIGRDLPAGSRRLRDDAHEGTQLQAH